LPAYVESSTLKTLKVDSQAPVTTDDITDPPQYLETATIHLYPTDALSGVSSTTYWLNTGTTKSGQTIEILTYGEYAVHYYSTDGAGNKEADHVTTVTVLPPDSDPPVTTSDIPVGWVDHSVTVSLEATDAVSDVANTKVSIGGDAYNIYTSPFIVADEGTTSVSYYSTDTRSNQETPVDEFVLIDLTDPTTTSDNDGTYRGGSLGVGPHQARLASL
jgi:hypothetical protein